MYKKSDIEAVRRQADIRNHVPNLHGRGASMYTVCPKCGANGKNKGLIVTHKAGLDLAKCFSCGFVLNGAIDAEKFYSGLSFPEAAKVVADRAGLSLREEKRPKKESSSKGSPTKKKSFCERQLEASGLTVDDVTATIVSNNETGINKVATFRKGGMDAFFNPNPNDDEMLIYYYDLDGNPMMYATRGARGALRQYIRVRWSNPALHADKEGREVKYQTPKGAPTKLYIPQYIRSRYIQEQHIETLIVQEGEKKAEKACKHGIASVGIQGIYNIGNAETGLIQDLQYLVQRCTVHNVILLMDSDWDDLHRTIEDGDDIDQRPNAFSKAVIKFKSYVQTMHNLGVSVDIYFAHINKNERGDKGIDDLLVGTLKGNEQQRAEERDRVMHSHDGVGTYLNVHKITSKTDFQIQDFWALNDRDTFFERHKEALLKLTQFRFRRISYRVEDGNFKKASNYASDKDLWEVSYNDKGKKNIEFDYLEALSFLDESGYKQIHTSDLPVGVYKYISMDRGVISEVGASEIRNYVYAQVSQSTKDRDVKMMFAAKLGSLLSADKLERLKVVEDNFDNYEPGKQIYYYSNGQVTITPNGIEHSPKILGQVWEEKIIKRKFRRVPIITRIVRDEENNRFLFEFSKEAEQCEFWAYIKNTSNFWRNREADENSSNEYSRHLANKITAIGYLLNDYKYKSETKAVVAMDGKMSEVAQSNGRSGKSLIGMALKQMMNQAFIDGRNLKNNDEFMLSTITQRTRNIFLDDIRVNFDFPALYSVITNDMIINPKGLQRFSIPMEKSPKFYITTNHAINASDDSTRARIVFMEFSDWYNVDYTPVTEFGHQFFDDWDGEQWCLFDNFMLECNYYYQRAMAEGWGGDGVGTVNPPLRDIRLRTLRQLIGEAFLQWADVFFDESATNLNNRLTRKAIYDSFTAAFPDKPGVTPTNFKTKIKHYCEFRGLHFNVTRPNDNGQTFAEWRVKGAGSFMGSDDKSNGCEYFTITSPKQLETLI